MRLPTEPMLTASTKASTLPAGAVAEPKWDGVRAFVARHEDGTVLIRSRNGTTLTGAFPELESAAAALPAALGAVLFDGEIVLWSGGKLAFEKLLTRLGRRPSTARRAAAEMPVNYVAFDLAYLNNKSLINQPYTRRRAELVDLFEQAALGPPWTLCPSSSDPDEIAQWLEAWPQLGIEGLVFKASSGAYEPGRRRWRKFKIRESTDAVVSAVTGRLQAPSSLLLGRFDASGRLRYVARTTPLARTSAVGVGALLTEAGSEHPWQGHKPSPRWNAADPREITLVEPRVVAEFTGDLAQDPRGVFRHLVRLGRVRPDLAPADAPLITDGTESAAG